MPKNYNKLVKEVRASELKAGKSMAEANRIAYATATKKLGKPKDRG